VRLPRDLSGQKLVRALGRLGYQLTRQTGSHLRLTCSASGHEHHVTIPNHDPLKIGTLNAILKDVAAEWNLTRDELLKRLFQ
jgi:predicted RNA binding protein YcfA (HicA-like mRNA interferase family)